ENARIENLGLEVIYAKGQAQNTTVYSGGKVQVLAGGTALNLNISQGGREEVKGKDSKAQIFGTQVISKGGQAQNTTVYSGGKVQVLEGGTALNLNVSQGGREEVKGKDSKAQILGTQVISKGGQAQNTTVTSGGRVEILSGGLALNLNINKGGKVVTFSQGKDSKAQIFGSHVVQRGGSSYQAQIVKNGVQEVLGLTQEATVKAQGLLTIKNQGLASKVTLHSQSLLQIAKGGQIKEIFAKKGAQIEAKSKASLADLTLQSGALCNLDGQVNLSGKNTFKAKATLIGGSSQNLVKLKSGSINLQGDNLLTKFYLETENSTLNIAGSNNKLGYLKVSKKTTINYKLANLDPKKDTTLLSLVKSNKQKIGSYQIYLTKNQNLGSYKLSNHLIPAKNQNFTIYLNNKKLGAAKINDKALEKRGFSLKLSLNKNLIKFSVKLQAGQILKPQASNFNLKGSQASDIFYTDKNNNTITGVDGRDVVIYNSFNWGKDIIKKTNGTINIVFCGLASSKIRTKKEGSNLVVSTTQNKNSKITISNWNDQTHKLVYAKK
ncbi:MAG: AIDA repeat-containing protein, partial [Desulfovibrionaceae bacterium]|nr:AIDA repeat-containing protein [Desulfovibrionaceae bacterium]